jgi:hypothetical protein
MPMLQQCLVKEEKAKEIISTAQVFKRMGSLVEEPQARKILINYLDSQNFYKISTDVLFFRKKLESFIVFLAKVIATIRNHDCMEPRDMKDALVVYFHLITTRDVTNLLNLEQIDGTKLFILHQLPLFSFYRNLIRRKFAEDGTRYYEFIQDKVSRVLENISELKKKRKRDLLEDYMNALEILGILQEKNAVEMKLTEPLLERGQFFLEKLLFDRTILADIETLYNLYRLLKNSQLLINLCMIEIPWETMKFLKSTNYYQNDLRISKILRLKNFYGLEYNRHPILNCLQFLSRIYSLTQNIYIGDEIFEKLFHLFDRFLATPTFEQIECIQIQVFPDWDKPTDTQMQDFFFTAFKKDFTKEAKDYLVQLRKWFSQLLVKHMGRTDLLLNHPKFITQLVTVILFLAYRTAFFTQHVKVDRDDVKVAFNQLCYLLLDAKFSYLK